MMFWGEQWSRRTGHSPKAGGSTSLSGGVQRRRLLRYPGMKTLPFLCVLSLATSLALADDVIIHQSLPVAPGGDTPSNPAQTGHILPQAPKTDPGHGLVDTPTSTGAVHDPASVPVRRAIPVAPPGSVSRIDGTGAGTDRAPGSPIEK